MKKLFPIILAFLISVFCGCTKTVYLSDNNRIVDGEYDSEFPHLPTTDYLEKINSSVKLVNALASYRGYELPLYGGLIRSELSDSLAKQKALREKYLNSPASGTATIIYHDNSRVALLTCAHIVSFPDTIITHFLDKNGKKTPFIQSVYYKVRQSLTVTGLPEVSDYEIIASDENKDIAVIGKTYNRLHNLNIREFDYPKGSAEELKAGTFVYLFGFPRGERMVSTAIVGRANKDKDHNFIVDAPMHKGISGGLVLAVRDGVPNFELVGMVFAVARESISFLGPDEETEPIELDMQRPYSGNIFLNSTRQIIYGITYAVSIESIQTFFWDHRDSFDAAGFDSNLFLNSKKPPANKM